jgi:hypothetical protein
MATKLVGLGVRVPEEVRDALNRAARDDLRSAASLVEKVMVAWLRESGYLGEPPKGGPTHRRNRPQPKLPEPKAEPEPAPAARERPQRRRSLVPPS